MAFPDPRSVLSFQSASETLVYEPFFHLAEKAFSLNSDLRFHFESPSHASSLQSLLDGIRRREGLIVLTGEIGSGKTMLCRAALKRLGRKTFSSFVPDPFSSREDLLKTLLIDFGVVSIDEVRTGALRGASRTELSYLLAGFLESMTPADSYAVVFLDEAQNLTAPMIDETRVLHDTLGAAGQLQIVFVGQLELHEKLKAAEMRQVDQRIMCYTRLAPLTSEAVGGYIRYRLRVAGHSGEPELFPADVIEVIHRRSGGIPRLINRLCDRALTVAHTRQSSIVDRACLDEALASIGAETFTPTWASIVYSEPAGSDAAPSALPKTTPGPVTPLTAEQLDRVVPVEVIESEASSDPYLPIEHDDNWLSRLDDWSGPPIEVFQPPVEETQPATAAILPTIETPRPTIEAHQPATEAILPPSEVIEPPAEVTAEIESAQTETAVVAQTTLGDTPTLPPDTAATLLQFSAETPDAGVEKPMPRPVEPRRPAVLPRVGVPATRVERPLVVSPPRVWPQRLAIASGLAVVTLAGFFMVGGSGAVDSDTARPTEAPATVASEPVAETPQPVAEIAPPAPAAEAPVEAPPAAVPLPPAAPASVALAPAPAQYFVAIGLYNNGSFADMIVAKLAAMDLPALRRSIDVRGKLLEQVVLGPFDSRAEAVDSLDRLQEYDGYDDARVIQVTPMRPS